MFVFQNGEKSEKAVVSEENWRQRLEKVKIPKKDLNALIMNFFMIEGYKEAAEKFREESNTPIAEVDLQFMEPRIAVRKHILDGEIDKAIDRVQQLNPEIFNQNQEILFELKLQKLIELIRDNKIDDAINYASTELVPMAQSNQRFMEEIEKVMSLLAFEDMRQSPVSDLAENKQRIKISSELNYQMLKVHTTGKEIQSKLPTLIKLLVWSQKRLAEKLDYPQIVDIANA